MTLAVDELSPYDSITFGNTLSLRVNGDIGAMSLSPSGRDAVLAGRRGLYIIDLDDPFSQPRWLHHVTSWEVADVQWSPHKSKPSWVISTSNQKAMVWNLERSSSNAIEHVLHGHNRAITDINFHPENPELLATCSVDTFVYAWDLRTPKRPIAQWADWRASASQVKWNFKNPNVIASSHDSHFYIWDIRKGAMPVHKVEAHNGRINGIDFGRINESEIISCSNDLTVKFWDYEKSIENPQYTINTDFPVNRARHLPFGESACGIMPMRGGNNSIYVVNYKGQTGESKLKPVHIFKGHMEPIKDFLWRSRHSKESTIDDREFQLVTWSKDCDLRLWPIQDDFYGKVNFSRNEQLPEKLTDFQYKTYRKEPEVTEDRKNAIVASGPYKDDFVSRKGTSSSYNNQINHLDWISGVRIGRSAFAPSVENESSLFGLALESPQPANLGEEVSVVGHKFPKIRFEKISVSTGNLVISLNSPLSATQDELLFLRLEINFPRDYPLSQTYPVFKIEENHELKQEKKQEILTALNDIAQAYVNADKYCLEPCLRALMGEKVNLNFENFENENLSIDPFNIPYDDENNNDYSSFEETSQTPISSDDSDDELVPTDNIIPSKDDHSSLEKKLQSKPAFDSTPVPKGCGAVWTPSGHLICFFIPKIEKPKSNLIKFDQEGFGLTGSLAKKTKFEASKKKSKNYSKLNLSSSEDEASSSDEDSFTEDWDDILQGDMPRISGFLRTNVGLRQYGNTAIGNKLSIPTDLSQATRSIKGESTSTKNIVEIYDFRYLIPSKMELAFEYKVLGETPDELAKHNALVAEKYGYTDIANCWKILQCVLVKDISKNKIFGEGKFDSSTLEAILRADLLESIGSEYLTFPENFRFFWGSHPFGAKWLIKKIFEYYERLGNVQMLAMLSCVLFENSHFETDQTIPLSVPYVRPQPKQNPIFTANNLTSNPYKNGNTENFNNGHNNFNISNRRGNSVSTSISSLDQGSFNSGSPDRFNSYFKKQIVTTPQIRRDDFLNDSYFTCQPISSMGKVESPNTQLNNERYPSTFSAPNWNHASISRATSFSTNIGKPFTQNLINSQNLQNLHNLQNSSLVVKVEMCNEAELDLFNDIYSVNLLSEVDSIKLQKYRNEYASMLYSWGLHVNRVNILKFNFPQFENKSPQNSPFHYHQGIIGWRSETGEEIKDENDFTSASINKVCNYCGLSIKKRIFVCTACEHVLHSDCASKWWKDSEEVECPTGCGCHCATSFV